MSARDERRERLEEAIRLLESARDVPTDFEDARLDGHLVTALTATRAALNLASERPPLEETGAPS